MASDPHSHTFTVAGYKAPQQAHPETEHQEHLTRTRVGIDSLRDSLLAVLNNLYRPDAEPVDISFGDFNPKQLWISINVEKYNRSARSFNASIDDESIRLAALLNSDGRPIKGFPRTIHDLDKGISDETVIYVLSELGIIEYHHHGVNELSIEARKGDPERYLDKEIAEALGSQQANGTTFNAALYGVDHAVNPHVQTNYYYETEAQKRRRRQLRAAIGLHPFPITIAFHIP